MSANDATSAIFDNGAIASARATTKDHKAANRKWWQFAARPLVLASGFFLLAAISAASMFFVVMSQSNSELVTHTLQVENQLSGLRALLRNSESAARGYLLSAQIDYRKDFEVASAAVIPAFADLKEMTADNLVQQQALVELGPLIVRRLAALQAGVHFFETGRADQAIAALRTGHGRAMMGDIRAIIARMTAEEHRLLALRTDNASLGNLLLLIGNFAGIALMISLAAISILTVRHIGAEALSDSEKRGDELQAAVNELDAFSYSVSHDLRTPLRAIDGFSRILLKHHAAELSPEPREYLQAVRDNTVKMGTLVDDLLAFSRLGRKPLVKKQVATNPMVEKVIEEIRQQDQGRSVNVSVGPLPDLWADPALLQQVFFNLVDNAFKYTRSKAHAVVEIGSYDDDGEQIFFVRDNGAGFDMQYADKLFGVFQRLHRAEDFEGTGVGLAIVQRIINRHGGRIWADAAVENGATFRFTIEEKQNDQ